MSAIPSWFLHISGLSLVVLGVLQIYTRPREPGDPIYRRLINAGTLWSLVCISAGIAVELAALGTFDREPAAPAASAPLRRLPGR